MKTTPKGINRREFSQLFSMLFCFLVGVKVVTAEETDNYGFHIDRTRINDRTGKIEKALADQWQEENKRYGGLLDLLVMQAGQFEGPDFDCRVSDRERKIVGMVVQWLGTNCGRSFLYEASRRMGAAQYPFEKACNLP